VNLVPHSAGRLAVLALLGVMVQVAAIAQIEIFGVPADLSPLLVMSVGLLCGSVPGAAFGFAVGLLLDTALLGSTIGYAILQFLLGADIPFSALLLREIIITIVLGTLLALPVYALVRRVLLPYLPDDPRRRRRRAYTTGGLSPLSRA
jgi:rod shape-determining protein MreD